MLQLKNIRKSYDGKVILDSISLDINDGEIVSILGPSGSGKTTLLNAILGLTEIDGGQIIFDGKDLTNVPMKASYGKKRFQYCISGLCIVP